MTITVLQDARQLVYPMGAQRVLQAVQLTSTIGPHGGKRPWFVCPTCQRRVGVLYHVNKQPFRCRTCRDLAYPSQYRSLDRSYGAAQDITAPGIMKTQRVMHEGCMMISDRRYPSFTQGYTNITLRSGVWSHASYMGNRAAECGDQMRGTMTA